MDDPEAVRTHIANAVAPQGYTRTAFPVQCKNKQDEQGICCTGKDANGKEQHYFFCLAHAECRQAAMTDPAKARVLLPLGTDGRHKTGKITDHNKAVHDEESPTVLVLIARKAELKKMQKDAKKLRGSEASRRVEQLDAVLTFNVIKALPLSLLGSKEVQEYGARRLANGLELGLYDKKVQRLIGELYLHVRDRATATIAPIVQEGRRVGVPMVGIIPDFVKIAVKSVKCLTLRVTGIDEDLNPVSQLVALREYNPSREMEEKEKAGVRISYFAELYLSDIGVTLADLIGGCSDSGSDIRNFVGTGLKVHSPLGMREWCVPHAEDCIAAAALGIRLMDNQNLNPEFAELWGNVKEVYNKLGQSQELYNLLMDKQQEMYSELGGALKPTRGLDHRWLGHTHGLRVMLSRWPAFDAAFNEYYCVSNGTNYKAVWEAVRPAFQVLVETLAVLEPIRQHVTEAQGVKQVIGHHTLFRFLELRLTLLSCDPAQEIKIEQFSMTDAAAPKTTTVTFASLQAGTKKTVEMLKYAADKKYFLPRYGTWNKQPRPLEG